jgi:hypothetical protein
LVYGVFGLGVRDRISTSVEASRSGAARLSAFLKPSLRQ